MSEILLYPVITEKASLQAERENGLQFAVDRRATRTRIRREVERRYGVTVVKVRTLIDTDGRKRAIVRLSSEDKAEELLAKIGAF